MTLWKLIAREVGRRPGRATLTLLSITIGIAAVVSVSLGTATARSAYRQMYEEITGHSAVQITAEGGSLFPEDLAAKVRQVPGVKAAVPSFQRRTVLFFQEKRLDLMILGIDPARDAEARDYELREGRFLNSATEAAALLEVGFADGAGIQVGDEVKLMTSRRPPLKAVTVVGLLTPRGAAGFNKGGAVFLPLHFAQRTFGRAKQVNNIDVVLQDGASESAVTEAVKAIVPTGLHVHPPAMRTQLAEGTTVEVEHGLYLASAFALVLGALIIVNTFLMNASERRPQLAILRAVGATRGQVVRMLLAEGLMLGLLGTVLGCLVGIGGGYLLMVSLTRLSITTSPPIVFPLASLLWAALLGPIVAVAAAGIPAYWTTRISPLEAMQPVVSQDGAHTPRWLTLSALVLSAVSACILVGSVRGWLPPTLSVFAGVGLVTLMVLLIPSVIGPLTHVVVWLARPLVRLEMRMAQRQVVRRPVRSGLTIGVVYIAMCVGIGLGTTIINTVDDVRAWYRQTVIGDFFLRAAFPDTATGQTIEIPLSIGDEIRKIPGVASIDAVRFFSAQVAGHPVFVIARDFAEPELPISLYRADQATVRQQLRNGEVVIGTVLAQEAGIQAGDDITLETREGPKTARVAALAIDYMVGGFVMYMERPAAQRIFHIEGVDAFAVTAPPKNRLAVYAALTKVAREHSLMLHSFAELSRMLDRIMGGVIGSLWGILVLGFVVAAFGIANTLTMNVLEQTRELALLRVVAMTRRQIRRLVLSEAGIIGIIGLGLGTISGISTAWMISLSMMPLLGYPIEFSVHPWVLSGSLGLGMTLVLLAALAPAQRAARLDLLIALQYE